MSQQRHNGWVMLLHQVPPTPPYLRAKVLRRLNQLGALPIKNSAYLLPNSPDHLEDLQWLRSEIVGGGGGAWIFNVTPASLTDSQIEEAFRDLRAEDYRQLLDAAKAEQQDPQKLKRKFDEIRAVDFFGAPGREEFESMMRSMAQKLQGAEPQPAKKPDLKQVAGGTWVTRQGVKVDRIASAWLIRRFIDPAARFVFVQEGQDAPVPGGIRFDMFEGEFTHEGELCTFEVLLENSGQRDPALQAIAQMVHDIDVKDAKYQRPETSGFAAMIAGVVALHPTDDQRIEEGMRLLETVYAALHATKL